MKHTLFIMYDQIDNSVFESQVLIPLIKHLDTDRHVSITLISYEKKEPDIHIIKQLNARHSRLRLLTVCKIPFLGKISLWHAAHTLRYVQLITVPSSIIARGPFAAWIAHSVFPSTPLTIQARGLAAQEYRYTHSSFWLHRLRAYQIESVEKEVYGTIGNTAHAIIECVSSALQLYIIEHFQASPAKVSVSVKDIPLPIEQTCVSIWRHEVRRELSIHQSAPVYVYAGSAHAWQCPQEMIDYFATCYETNKHSVLLILTKEVNFFSSLLKKEHLPLYCYRLLTVDHEAIYRYLSAADHGLLFRKPHPINWVSRPTKALEYQAVGLSIHHNNTIAWLTNKKREDS